ncbi:MULTISPECIES: HigA family addiction module antitoxin [Acetobacter]|uniref:HigA family addiction module antitoxin n=1 Tax=Acetobacter TaxID=434 RepID=UPI001E5F3879|nr:HigA family addiction module antitoxin [Acetobacter pomorum]
MTTGMRGFSLRPVPPGKTLESEMKARGLSANALALKLQVPANRISDIVRNKRGITAETAIRLGRAFGNSADFWLSLQKNYELSLAKSLYEQEINNNVGVIEA